MGLILDSSVVIASERRGETVANGRSSAWKIVQGTEVALSAMASSELSHGLYERIRRMRLTNVNRSSKNCWQT